MIRRRDPARDDRMIYRLVVRYLLPYKRTFFPDADFSFRDLKNRLMTGRTWVYAEGGKGAVKGFCHVVVRDHVLWIDMIALDQAAQGKRRGRALMLQAERFGRSRRCTTCSLLVDEHNVGAQRFYRRLGYEKRGYSPQLHVFVYEKEMS